MAIVYLPSRLLKDLAPKKLIEDLVGNNLTVKKTIVKSLHKTAEGVVTKKQLNDVALKVAKQYREAYAVAKEEGIQAPLASTLNDKVLMVQRVQNLVVSEVAKDIRKNYDGEFYEWLPSDSVTPDPLHSLNYGGKFRIGVGEMPGDRYGCKCGMKILVDEVDLDL